MRKLVVACLTSLDGVIASPGTWNSQFFDEECAEHALNDLAGVDAFLLGRRTYDELFEKWSKVKGNPYIDRINALPKWVASRTLDQVGWNGSVLKGDAASAIAAEKSRPGGTIIKYGIGDLDRTLLAHGLVDELKIWIFPTLVGTGKKIFDDIHDLKPTLKLLDVHQFKRGSVALKYSCA